MSTPLSTTETAMDTSPSPASEESVPPSPPASAENMPSASASYAEVTQELFPSAPSAEASRKRAPPSPGKERPAAKKSTSPPSATPSPLPQRPDNPFLNCFMKAINKSGPNRVRLMTKVNGDVFYNWRALHFQHTYGNIADVDPRATIMRQRNTREQECWRELHGTVRKDAFADLLRYCDNLRKEHPKLFDQLFNFMFSFSFFVLLMAVSLVTINVNGIAEALKRAKVFHSLLSSHFDIFLLQETHLSSASQGKEWEREWGGTAAWSPGSNRSAGVAVLFQP